MGERSVKSHQPRAQTGTPHSQLLWSPSCNSDLSLNLCVLSEVRWDNGAWTRSLEPPGASRSLPASLTLRTLSSGTPSPLPGKVPRGEGGVARARSCAVTSGRLPSASQGLHSSCEYPCARGSVALNSKLKTKQTKQNSNTKGQERNYGKKEKAPRPRFLIKRFRIFILHWAPPIR